MLTTYKAREDRRMFNSILILSSWGFVMVITSFIFLYLGHLLDEVLGTAPNFMFGLFFLALFMSIGRLYQEAWLKRKGL